MRDGESFGAPPGLALQGAVRKLKRAPLRPWCFPQGEMENVLLTLELPAPLLPFSTLTRALGIKLSPNAACYLVSSALIFRKFASHTFNTSGKAAPFALCFSLALGECDRNKTVCRLLPSTSPEHCQLPWGGCPGPCHGSFR